MMTRLLSITLLLFILLSVGCNKKTVALQEGVPITFSGAFELVETKNPLTGDAVPDIDAQVLGSREANNFTTIYTHEENFILGAVLDQPVTFIEGEGVLTRIVHYPSDGTPVYLKAYAPSSGIRDAGITPNVVLFEGLTGHEDVMLTLPNTAIGDGEGRGTVTDRDISLTFRHKLSKVSFKFIAENVDAAAEWGSVSNLTLLEHPNNITLYLNVATLDDYFVDESVFTDITLFDDAVDPLVISTTEVLAPFSPMVPPSAYAAMTDSWVLRITSTGNGTRELPATYLFEPGHHHEFLITLKDNAEVAFNVKVTDWEEADNTGGNNSGDL